MNRLILILIMGVLAVPLVSAQEAVTIGYGESYVGEFTNDNSTMTLEFEGTAGDVIYIIALDIFVPVEFTLLSPTGGQLATSSDNARILNIELGADGAYSIVLNRPDWSDTEGEFTVHLGRYTVESLIVEDEGWSLSYEGNLAGAGALQQFHADFDEGELVTMLLYGTNIGMSVETADGEMLIFEGGYDDPVIPLLRLPETGTYTISVQTIEVGGSDYSLYISKREPLPVAVNEPLRGQVEEGLPTVFAFETLADKMWDINAVLPENGDRTMAIYQFGGDRDYWEAQIHFDWGSGPNGQPRIRPFIPTEGDTYYIALWYDNWDTEYALYDYEFMVSPSTLLSIPNNSPITGEISTETGNFQYAYQGNAGDVIRVSFNKLSKDGALAMAIYSAEDEVITFAGRNANSASFEVELPFDGFYEVVVYNYDYDAESVLEYEILIEPLEAD